MSVWSKAQNYATAAVFARRLLALNPTDARVTTQVLSSAPLSPSPTACTSR